MQEEDKLSFYKPTRLAIIATSLLNESFIAFFGLLPFILRKELHATIFQISLFTTIKPAISVLSFYWSIMIAQKFASINSNLLLTGLFARIPFLLFPLFNSVWYMIFASAIYTLFSRASIPSWMEVLKLNLAKPLREKIFSLSSALGYVENILIAIALGAALDFYVITWKLFFLFSTFLGICSVFIQWRTPVAPSISMPTKWSSPFKDGIKLLLKRKDFAHFQIGSFINIFGFMIMVPTLTIFYADTLKLSYTEMSIGRYIFMGLGYVFFASFWARALSIYKFHKLTSIVCLGFGFFPFFVLLAYFNHAWIYCAFMLYGITQAGSHLIWNMSGPIFAKEEDSAPFSSINVLMVGIRGLIAPLIGGILVSFFSPFIVLFLGAFFCFLGSFYLFKKKAEPKATEAMLE
jgi:hypothetical protein